MSKEMWFDQWNEIYCAALDAGASEAAASKRADQHADGAYRERIADMIDDARLRAKEGR